MSDYDTPMFNETTLFQNLSSHYHDLRTMKSGINALINATMEHPVNNYRHIAPHIQEIFLRIRYST